MLSIPSIVFISLFAVASILELVFAFLEKEKLRLIVKPFCLTFLLIFTIITLPNFYLLYIGVFFDLLGDIFLISRKKKIFYIGVGSFLLGHIFYFVSLLAHGLFQFLPWYSYIIISVILVIAIILIAHICYKKIFHKTYLSIIAGFYYGSLIGIFALSIAACFLGFLNFMWLVALGALIYFVSDVMVIYQRFILHPKRGDFYIMSTYLVGQACIILGIVFTVLTYVQ